VISKNSNKGLIRGGGEKQACLLFVFIDSTYLILACVSFLL
jgi:hypothetical protein